jgi:ferredoxin
MAKLKVTVDPDLCIAAAACMGSAPKFFRMDDENRAVVVGADGSEAFSQIVEVTDAEKAAILEAAGSCPTTAIAVEDIA